MQLYTTQGGGLAEYDNVNERYVFVEAPDPSTELSVGDFVPIEWGIEPLIENIYRDELDVTFSHQNKTAYEVYYDNNVCIICRKQHRTKQEMIDCGCMS